MQRRHQERCVMLNNAFEKPKTYFHSLLDNKSRGARAFFQRKNSESSVNTQTSKGQGHVM